MENKLRIKPLLLYKVEYSDSYGGKTTEAFTAESHETDKEITRFYRTGNIIREYQYTPLKIVISPVDEDTDIPE